MSGKRVKKRGSKREVWDGAAEKTKGGLNKSSLMMNKKGKVVSTKRHSHGKNQIKYLQQSNLKRAQAAKAKAQEQSQAKSQEQAQPQVQAQAQAQP